MAASTSTGSEFEIPLACNLSALDDESRAAHIANGARLLSDVAQERQESRAGLRFRFKAEDYRQVVEFIAKERMCCPFFHFTLHVSPAQGPIWLHISGPDGAKTFLQTELSLK